MGWSQRFRKSEALLDTGSGWEMKILLTSVLKINDKQKKINRMRVLSGAQWPVYTETTHQLFWSRFQMLCKTFSVRLTFIFTEFKARIDGWYFTSYIYSCFTFLAYAHRQQHVGGEKGITNNTEILGRQEAYGKFRFLRKSNVDETHTPKQRTK